MLKKETAPDADRGGEEALCSNTTSYDKSNTQLQELPGGYVPGKGKIEKLFVDGIEVRADHREVDQDVVKALAESMQRVGLLSPILVRVSANENNDPDILISGRHRLEAAKLLGWDFIDGYGLCIGDAAARVREISENLHRAELSKLDRAKQTSELIALYSSLDEEEKKLAQVAQVSKGGRGKRGGKSETARLMSIPRREIERAEKIASIIPEAQEAAKAAGIDDNQSKLLEVAAAPPEKQVQAVKSVSGRRKKASLPDDMPTEEEANESYQNTLYDHACLFVDKEMSDETRQRFFAHLKKKETFAEDACDFWIFEIKGQLSAAVYELRSSQEDREQLFGHVRQHIDNLERRSNSPSQSPWTAHGVPVPEDDDE